MTFDWRMDRSSYLMIAFIFLTVTFFILYGANFELPFIGILQSILFGALCTLVLICLACVPVIIVCYFINKIPDIDYSVWVAFGATLVGIVSELVL